MLASVAAAAVADEVDDVVIIRLERGNRQQQLSNDNKQCQSVGRK